MTSARLLPIELPLFPLPTTVLFPHVSLPLHIFEPRYRQMVCDALAGDRLIGMVLLKAGWEHDYDGRPPIFEVGCAGLITHNERLADGRYNIVLQGLEKFRILGERDERPYRIGRVEPIEDGPRPTGTDRLKAIRRKLQALVGPVVERAGGELRIPPTIPDHELINALAQYLPLEPLERQALLERETLVARGQSLVELLQMKALLLRGAAASSTGTH